MKTRNVITAHEFACVLSEAYSNCVDMPILESKKKSDKDWFLRVGDIVKFILYNEFEIEVVNKIIE
jgi:hypothetical protein